MSVIGVRASILSFAGFSFIPSCNFWLDAVSKRSCPSSSLVWDWIVKYSWLLYLSFLTGILSFLAIEPIWANESSNRIEHSQLEQDANAQIPAIPLAIKDSVPPPTALPVSAAKAPTPKIPEISDLPPLSTQAADLIAQDAPRQDQRAEITGVNIQTTATGIEIKLETDAADSLPSSTQVEGNTLVTKIDNAVLALPEGQSFRQQNPAEGIR